MRQLHLTVIALLLSMAAFATTPITGSYFVCAGSSTTLSSTPGGGTWTSSNPSIATIGASTGVLTGLALGTSMITYTDGVTPVTQVITVNSTPAAITGPSTVCGGGANITLTDVTAGGSWSSSSTGVVTINTTTGVATGIAAGTAIVTYSMPGSGCFATKSITVNAGPTAIGGSLTVCLGLTSTLTDAVSGGTWSSSNPAIASISASGVVTGNAVGVTAISYSLSSGCFVSAIVTVNNTPAAIGGTLSVCAGAVTTLTNSVSGGSWSSTNASVAVVGSGTGIVTGVAAGTATISYITGPGCAVWTTITVTPPPSAITGTTTLCTGGTSTLSASPAGGTWSSSALAVCTAGAATGILTGISFGSSTISYTTGAGCSSSVVVTVLTTPAAITGTSSICVGGTGTLADASVGGLWSSSISAVATVNATTGVVSGISSGTATISYTISMSCSATTVVTVGVSPVLYTVTGGGSYCAGGTGVSVGLVASDIGVTYQLYNGSAAVGAPITGTGAALDFGVMTAAGTYSVFATGSAGCSMAMTGSATVSINPLPTVTASYTAATCGSNYTLTASGASSYSWSPATGLSCVGCASPAASITGTTTYTVAGTSLLGCTGAATVTITANRINGHVNYGTTTPSVPDAKVWLIQYDPTDSSLTAMDSMLTCSDAGMQYFEFDGKASGSYLVKAKLLSAVAGTSDYVPTYGLSDTHWDMATSITHGSGTNTQNIDMIYGSVPTGPGFIGGLIVSGAGKGTSGDVPVAGMMVYLLNVANNVLTYVVTDASGMYAFSNLANGSYIIYPEDYHYATTPSATISLSAASETANGINFKQHTTAGTITPYDNTGILVTPSGTSIALYPNPTSGLLNMQWQGQQAGAAVVSVTDVTGRVVYTTSFDMATASGNHAISLSSLKQGVYFVSVHNNSISYSTKVTIAK